MKEIEIGSNIRVELVNKWLNGFRCKVALHQKSSEISITKWLEYLKV